MSKFCFAYNIRTRFSRKTRSANRKIAELDAILTWTRQRKKISEIVGIIVRILKIPQIPVCPHSGKIQTFTAHTLHKAIENP
jgi:hypothetical protein